MNFKEFSKKLAEIVGELNAVHPFLDGNGRVRAFVGVVGCNNARTKHNEGHIAVVKELIKNDVVVLTTGCNGIACAMEGMLMPESAAAFCGPRLAEVCETVGIPPVLHI